MPAPTLARGPSLPPEVVGELLGTLTIRLQACSLTDVSARVQFWGEQTYSDLCLLRDGLPFVESSAIEYPLLGSIHDLCTYLIDASPLKVTFLRHPQNYQQFRTEGRASSCVQLQPVIVGYAYLQDICIKDLTKGYFEQECALKTIILGKHASSCSFEFLCVPTQRQLECRKDLQYKDSLHTKRCSRRYLRIHHMEFFSTSIQNRHLHRMQTSTITIASKASPTTQLESPTIFVSAVTRRNTAYSRNYSTFAVMT